MNDLSLKLRRVRIEDVPFLARIDLAVDVEDADNPNEALYCNGWGAPEYAAHSAKIAGFVTDSRKSAWVCGSSATENAVGMLLTLCEENMLIASDHAPYLKHLIDEGVVTPNVPFCEVFQLWVDPSVRRRGIASSLKLIIEDDARANGCRFIYTHTRASNLHVVRLNINLGYKVIRTGPLWDDVVRISLIKPL